MKLFKTTSKHLLFWLSIPFLSSCYIWIYQFAIFAPSEDRTTLNFLQIVKNYAILNLIIVLIGSFGFYAAYYLITPQILYPSKRSKLILSIIITLIAPLLIIYILSLFSLDIAILSESLLLTSYIIIIPFSIFGTLLKVWNYGRLKEKENALLENKNLETHLALLKTQISPHFLFNTINNIDVLIENDPNTASSYLKKLGDLLRFMLYRVNGIDEILLEDEIECLKKYIDLQKIRSINPNFVNFTITGNPSSKSIVPMILMVFVENAFKYVANKKVENAIEFQLEIFAEKVIFRSKNNSKRDAKLDNKNSGIGLDSVKQRLDLIYKDKYNLDIKSDDNYFNVILKIDFE